MSKKILLLALILISSNAFAIQFGNETEIPTIDASSFKMMKSPQLDSTMFIQLRLIDSDANALENYHTELKIYDSRGVKIYPRTWPIDSIWYQWNLDSHPAFSDSNGFINYHVPLPSCNIFVQDFCFQLDQNYTVALAGKDIYREEYFTPKLKQVQTNWAGDFLRYSYVNIQSFFIILLSLMITIIILIYFYRGFVKK